MDDGFRTYWGQPVEISVTPRPVVASAHPLDTQTATPLPSPTLRCFVNDALNSRASLSVGDAGWRVLWRADLPGAQTPLCVAGTEQGLVVQSLASWSLWSALDGKPVKQATIGASGVTVDPELAAFYVADQAGLLPALKLSDGTAAFKVAFYEGKNYARTFVARRGHLLVTTSTERAEDPHSPDPENSMVEMTDLHDEHAPKSFDRPGGAVGTVDLIRPTRLLLTAMYGNEIYLATLNRIYRLDLGLKFLASIQGSFTPLAMSLDEAGRIYLVVEAQGRTELWAMSNNGERYYAAALPPNVTTGYPPAIGYDHVVYLVFKEHILAFAADGKLKWSRGEESRVSGILTMPNGEILVAAGNEISIYNTRGRRRPMLQIPGERFATPPALMPNGDIAIASMGALFRLTAKPE